VERQFWFTCYGSSLRFGGGLGGTRIPGRLQLLRRGITSCLQLAVTKPPVEKPAVKPGNYASAFDLVLHHGLDMYTPQDSASSQNEVTAIYERVGGYQFFVELVERFYEFVEADPSLRPLYPEDLEPGKAHLAAFLAQYWGGPDRYTLERGHPRLRQRHMRFPIGQQERDAWVTHMVSALYSMEISVDATRLMEDYFRRTATVMMNR
jgi:hemoglobin